MEIKTVEIAIGQSNLAALQCAWNNRNKSLFDAEDQLDFIDTRGDGSYFLNLPGEHGIDIAIGGLRLYEPVISFANSKDSFDKVSYTGPRECYAVSFDQILYLIRIVAGSLA